MTTVQLSKSSRLRRPESFANPSEFLIPDFKTKSAHSANINTQKPYKQGMNQLRIDSLYVHFKLCYLSINLRIEFGLWNKETIF